MSGRSVNLTTLFLGRLRPPKRLTSTSCAYFRQQLTTALLEKAEGERKYVSRPGIEPRTPDLRVRSPTDCATWPGLFNSRLIILTITILKIYPPPPPKKKKKFCLKCHFFRIPFTLFECFYHLKFITNETI